MSCEFCEKADFGCFRAELDSGYAHISLAGGCSRFPKEEQFAYCPVCGEALAEPEPLTLEELKGSHNEVVWITDSGRNTPVIVDARRGYAFNAESAWRFSDYGKEGNLSSCGWSLAYRRPPKGATP